MHALDRLDRAVYLLSPTGHFDLELGLFADLTDLAQLGHATGKRPPAPGHRAVGQAAIIFPDMPGIHISQRLLQGAQMAFRDKNFQFTVGKFHALSLLLGLCGPLRPVEQRSLHLPAQP